MKRKIAFRKTHRFKRKKSILKNRFFWIFLLILVFLTGLFYLFIFSSLFQVKKINISGNDKASKEQIESKIENYTEIKFIFPTKSIFLVNLEELKEDILNSFLQISDIDLSKKFPDTIEAFITERIAIANFCQNNECFFLDPEGVIFEKSLPIVDLLMIENKKIAIDQLFLGENVIEKNTLEKIIKIQENILEEFDFKLKECVIFNDRLNVKTIEGWEIHFDPKEDLNWQLTKLNLVLKEKIPPEKRKDLEYIELRFGDLAPFKYR